MSDGEKKEVPSEVSTPVISDISSVVEVPVTSNESNVMPLTIAAPAGSGPHNPDSGGN